MNLRVPLVASYLPLNYHSKCEKLNVIIDESDNNDIYISLLCGYNHILKTLIIKPSLAIDVKCDEWRSSHRYYLSSGVFAYIDNDKLVIANKNDKVDEYKASRIIKYTFNPHERVGAIIFTDTSIFRKKSYAIIGFNDGSYSIFESSLLDVAPYVNGFIVAYKDGKQIVLEKIPYGVESRYNIETSSLALHNYNGLVSITHDNGSLIVNGRNMEVLSNVSLRNGIPLGIANNMIVLWNPKSHTVYMREYTNNTSGEKIALICKSRPILAGVLGDKILLSCSNSVLEVKDNNWRLHEVSKKILGKQLVSTVVVGKSLVVGTLDKTIVWGAEKYYFRVMNLLSITKYLGKYLIIVDGNGVGVVDINEYIEGSDIVSYNKLQFDGNLRLRRRIEFKKNLVVSKIISYRNKVIKKKQNSFDIIFIEGKPVVFDIVYYGKYKVENDTTTISNEFKVLSAGIISYKTTSSMKILNIKYTYTNPLNKDILKPITIKEREIGYIKLKKRSKGLSLVQIPINNSEDFNHIRIENIIIPINKHTVQKTQYSINNVLIDLIDGKITLLVKILTNNPVNQSERTYVCVRGFLNGCRELRLVNNADLIINVPVTINYSKDYINISLYGLLELPYEGKIIEYDRKSIAVNSDTISLIMITHKDKLYVIVDDLPSINDDIIILIDGVPEKYKVRKLPFLLSYKSDKSLEKKTNAVLLQLYRGTLYYSRNNCWRIRT